MIVEMASACINNISLSPEKFLDCPATFPSYGWLSPQMSFGRDEEPSKPNVKPRPQSPAKTVDESEVEADREHLCDDIGDFEFRLDYPVTMLPADELFSDGKLMPLQFRPAEVSSEMRLPDTPKVHRSCEIAGMDPYLFSPKAPRCSSRWKELLGLKRLYQNNNAKLENPKTMPTNSTGAAKSLKHFLHRNSKSSPATDASLSLPLLRDTDNESISISSRLSLSSSSSGHDHDDLPRLSLDLEKPHSTNSAQKQHQNPPRIRLVKHRTVHSEGKINKSPMRRQMDSNATTAAAAARGGVSLDSPRMNSSGKIVFQSLERSSSSPSSFNGGPRHKHRGVERSYSANVRVTPVLNVPVCSLRGSSKSGGVFGFPLFSAPPHKRDNGSTANGSRSSHHQQPSNSKSKTDRTSN